MSNLNNLIKISIVSFLIYGVACAFTADIASATIDKTAHWPVEVTSRWNAVYGRVTGAPLEDGDSVGMFDIVGNCYGAGLVKGGYYFLSAFMWEETHPLNPNDFDIPGFKGGDIVIFIAYKEDTGEEYLLVPSDGGSYTYAYNENKGNPVRIDLVYEETISPREDEEPFPLLEVEPLPDEGSEEPPRIVAFARDYYPDRSERLGEEHETEEIESDITPALIKRSEETEEKISYKEDISKRPYEVKEPIHKESYDEYEPTDYYEGEGSSTKAEPSRHIIDEPSKYTAQAGKAVSSGSASWHRDEDKETIAEATAAEPTSLKFKDTEEKTSKKNLQLLAMIILGCIIAISVVIAVKRLNRQ